MIINKNKINNEKSISLQYWGPDSVRCRAPWWPRWEAVPYWSVRGLRAFPPLWCGGGGGGSCWTSKTGEVCNYFDVCNT